MDLEDLDALGVDGVVAGYEGADDVGPTRRHRHPWVSALVIAFSTYLLATMFGDFRYWLQSSEPEDLGHAAQWVEDGSVPEGFHDRHVVLEGTPDVQNAARLSTDQRYIGYLRITEGDGRLFAAVPRSKEVDPGLNFAGRYEGRMVRLGSDRAFPWLQQFYRDNDITRSIEVQPQALEQALQEQSGAGLTVQTSEGPVQLGPDDEVRLVVRRSDARIQLGVESFPDAEQAKALIEELGHPFRVDDAPPNTFHEFIVRVPESQRDAVREQLEAALESPPDPADPKEGVSVLPMTATYLVPSSGLRVEQGAVLFELPENSPGPGYDVVEGGLRERDLGDAPMRVEISALATVRLEKPIVVDPEGYLVVVGADPSTERTVGIAWLVVLGIALVNAGALVLALRRRRRR